MLWTSLFLYSHAVSFNRALDVCKLTGAVLFSVGGTSVAVGLLLSAFARSYSKEELYLQQKFKERLADLHATVGKENSPTLFYFIFFCNSMSLEWQFSTAELSVMIHEYPPSSNCSCPRFSNNESTGSWRGKGACLAVQSAEHPTCHHKVRNLIGVQMKAWSEVWMRICQCSHCLSEFVSVWALPLQERSSYITGTFWFIIFIIHIWHF